MNDPRPPDPDSLPMQPWDTPRITPLGQTVPDSTGSTIVAKVPLPTELNGDGPIS